MTTNLVKSAAIVGLVMILGSLGFHAFRITASVAAGVAISLANLWLLTRLAHQLMENKAPLQNLVGRCLVKFLATGIVVWWVVTQTSAQPAALLVGLSAVVIPIAGLGLGVGHARV